MTSIFKLMSGWCPGGEAFHPIDHVGDYPNLDAVNGDDKQTGARLPRHRGVMGPCPDSLKVRVCVQKR